MFKLELHCHARTASCDSEFDEKSIAIAFKNAGYDGFIISNHYSNIQLAKYSIENYGSIRCTDYKGRPQDCPFEQLIKKIPEEDKLMEYYYMWLGSAKLAIMSAAAIGIKCFMGMEYQLATGEHIAVLGCTIDEFEQDPLLPSRDIHYLSDYVHSKGGILVQNHPFRRKADKIQTMVDGYECINTKYGVKDVFTESAFNHLTGRLGIFTCGSDAHNKNELGRCYTELMDEPKDEKELVSALREGRYYNYILEDLDDNNGRYQVCPL